MGRAFLLFFVLIDYFGLLERWDRQFGWLRARVPNERSVWVFFKETSVPTPRLRIGQ
jgi:hypothetical protein